MYIVYILLSLKDHKLYVGCTQNLKKRILAHNNGYVTATSPRKPFVVIHTENFSQKADAFARERYLKSLWSGRFKRRIKENYILTHGLKPASAEPTGSPEHFTE